jgi:hypothetical protein
MSPSAPISGGETMTERTCSSCRFWKPEQLGIGECRRHAPVAANQAVLFTGEAVVAVAHVLSRHWNVEWPEGFEGTATETNHSAMFPTTWDEDWCGEHQPKHQPKPGSATA